MAAVRSVVQRSLDLIVSKLKLTEQIKMRLAMQSNIKSGAWRSLQGLRLNLQRDDVGTNEN